MSHPNNYFGLGLSIGLYILIFVLIYFANQKVFKVPEEEIKYPTLLTNFKQAIQIGLV
ncbi:hypothetical protein [Legionella sp. km535]|uniref:hypothetical protein n=1 Tax=Legionella sp. km535 TaxID=2498107 RepID=UPI0013152590|nr:hypothetical protein [Legionella sp. km535]